MIRLARRCLAMMVKEWKNVARRDLIFLVLIQPVIWCLVWGFCASLELRQARISVLDQDGTAASRAVARSLEASGRFVVTQRARTLDEVRHGLASGGVSAALIIPPTFERDRRSGDHAALGLVVDGTDPVVTTTGLAYAVSSANAALDGAGAGAAPPASLRALYNRSLRSIDLLLLGALCYNLIFFACYPAQSLLDERKSGTLVPLAASPVGTFELWLGTIAPNAVIALWGTFVQIGVLTTIGGVAFRGNGWVLVVALMLITYVSMNFGCLLAIISGTNSRLTIYNIAIMLVMMIFAGFLVPSSYLPGWAQSIGEAVPLTHGLTVVRAIFQKGAGFAELSRPLGILALMAAVLTVLALLCVRSLLASQRR
jgi:ABC-type multidrug transport system permease subunit